MSELGDIADAVAATINMAAVGVTAERTQDPTFPRDQLVGAKCLVVPVAVESRPISRSLSEYDTDIHVGVFGPLVNQANRNAEFDFYYAIAERIEALFTRRRLATYPAAAWVRSARRNREAYSQGLVHNEDAVGVVLVLTFRTVR
jgi:hypothetical protein